MIGLIPANTPPSQISGELAMSITENSTYAPLDLDAIRRDNPLPDVAGAVVKLQRAGREWNACCPFHSERTPSFTIFSGGERYHCFGCGASGDVLDFVQALHGVGLREAADMLGADTLPRVTLPATPVGPDKSEKIAEAKAIWESAVPAVGTLAETYLRSRAITCEVPMSVRYAELPYGVRGRICPTLIACISSPQGPLQGIQRTFLSVDGLSKASVPKAKLALGMVSGGAIRLGPVDSEMIVTEGLEDGLSLQQELGRSVWVACGRTNLSNVMFPHPVLSVAIGGDNDDPGRESAGKAVRAHAERGLKAHAFFPSGAKDFNELIQKEAVQ